MNNLKHADDLIFNASYVAIMILLNSYIVIRVGLFMASMLRKPWDELRNGRRKHRKAISKVVPT